MKLKFYLLSMWLFYLIVIILSFPDTEKSKWYMYVLPALAFFALFYVSVFFIRLYYYRKLDSAELAVRVEKVSDKSYETLAFLASYFVPLVSFEFNTPRHHLVLLILFVAIGIIYTRSGFYFANPTLAILGLRTYSATIVFQDGTSKQTIIISREPLEDGSFITYHEVDRKEVIAAKLFKNHD